MSTLFIGRLRDKGDRLMEAAPAIAGGLQQAGNALINYDQMRYERNRQAAEDLFKQEQMQQRIKKDKLDQVDRMAKMFGGYSLLPQSMKNDLPALYGMDFDTDEQGNVVISQTLDEQIAQYKQEYLAQAGPEAMGVMAGVMDKAPNPRQLEADTAKANLELKNDLVLKGAEHSNRMLEIAERAKSKGTGQLDAQSGYWVDVDGTPLAPGEFHQKYGQVIEKGEDLPVGVMPVTYRGLDRAARVSGAKSLEANRKLQRARTEQLIDQSTKKFIEQSKVDPTLKVNLENAYKARRLGADGPEMQAVIKGLEQEVVNQAIADGIDPVEVPTILQRVKQQLFGSPKAMKSTLAQSRESAAVAPIQGTFQGNRPFSAVRVN